MDGASNILVVDGQPGNTWEQFVSDLEPLGYDVGRDPGPGAIVAFDDAVRGKILITGATSASDYVKTIREWCAALVVGKHNSVETVRPSRKLQCFVLATFGRNRGLVRFSRHPFLDRFNFRFDVVLCA